MRIGIDATNVGGGGGITHLKEILSYFSQDDFSVTISRIVIFSSDTVLKQIPEIQRLEKISFPDLNSGLFSRVLFQIFKFDKHIKSSCDILFSVTGDFLGNFTPVVGMSRNMLLYDRSALNEIGSFKERSRFYLNFLKQKRCFKNSVGLIFISSYAKREINRILSINGKNQVVIHHGISTKFIGKVKVQESIDNYSPNKPFRFLYVSTVHVYKHHVNVVRALAALKLIGLPVELHLVGGIIFKPAGDQLMNCFKELDPSSNFIIYHGHQPYDEIEKLYQTADGIIFASSCENMPNILIESMASGLPIACSNYQPMPEFLEDGGFYFDPKSVKSIEKALLELLHSPKERYTMCVENIERVKKYSWEKTSKETFQFIIDQARKYNVQK
ncbi:glycosyltransferase family 4 protein [Algoriphagus mannitolivorans]|uniref:glycosyltransferase family 4 protein n=1 Tax=Algoriphagus mannitolivorans TaxID=226504 RepID=UPI0004109FB3|nr:glycosyltransferase family 1 protein [Algoriphagus mannitolivorans]